MQRAATSTAVLDSLSSSDKERDVTRRVGTRIFNLRDSVWTDARYLPSMRTIRVKAFSPLYFDLVVRLSGLADAVGVGDRAIVAGRLVAIAIAADGAEPSSAISRGSSRIRSFDSCAWALWIASAP